MNPLRQLKVFVELGPPEEPIRGLVELPSGERIAFSGWIGLVAAIEAARMSTAVEGQPLAQATSIGAAPPDEDEL